MVEDVQLITVNFTMMGHLGVGQARHMDAPVTPKTDLLAAMTAAGAWCSSHRFGGCTSLGVQNVDSNEAGTEPKVLQVVSDDCGKVLVVLAIAVAVQVGAVLPSLAISKRLAFQLVRDPAGQPGAFLNAADWLDDHQAMWSALKATD